jgi:predicted RNase H-like nuclease (RuvC/YqgF family)
MKEQLLAANKRILRLDREITRSEAQIANQTLYNAELLENQEELIDRLDSLEKSMGEEKRHYRAELLKDRKYRLLERDVSFLRSQLMEERALSLKLRGEVTELKQAIWLEARSGFYPIKVIKKFSRNDIIYTQDKLGLALGDIVLIVDGSGAGPKTAELLVESHVKAVIIQKGSVPQAAAKELIEAKIPLFYADEGILRIGDVALIAIDVLNERLEQAELEVDNYHLTKAQSDIDKIVYEHRDDSKNDFY